MTFEATSLWRAAFPSKKDGNEKVRERFRVAYRQMRDRVTKLVSLIAKDMPDYTVHDITHLDALWELASQIAGPGYPINPAEAFVLGGAILLHDAGMTIAAFPGGLEELKNRQEWRDTVALMSERTGRQPTDERLQKDVLAEVLRALHATQARVLAVQKWRTRDNRDDDFLIEEAELRALYGETIGLVARSHWLSVGELENEFPRKLGGLPAGPADWTVDVLKVACLLRVADASHVDSRRAPRFLRTLVRPSDYSDEHWAFQGRLPRPIVSNETMTFSAGGAFPENEANAWWLCFDTINMIDRELREVDYLLSSTGRRRLEGRRVEGAGSPSMFRRFVGTDGWEPVDTRLHVSNVPALVDLLGGKALYGDDVTVALRELLQNAADAVRARRKLSLAGQYTGKIIVRVMDDGERQTLEVEDDGVGMSEFTLLNVLLDFGKSLWRSQAVQAELPGLASSGMKAIGRFGIGFFSTFMLGRHIRVHTRRYDKGVSSQLTLEFLDGTRSRPILRRSVPPGYAENGGTCVSIQLANDAASAGGLLNPGRDRLFGSQYSLLTLIHSICPCLDVTVEYRENANSGVAVAADDWKTIPGSELLKRIEVHHVESVEGQMVQPFVEANGEIVGRAAAARHNFQRSGALVDGGFVVCPVDRIVGVVFGSVTNAARTLGNISVSADSMKSWATAQTHSASKIRKLDDEDKLSIAATIASMGGSVGKLPIIRRGNQYWSKSKFNGYLRTAKSLFVINNFALMHESDDECSEFHFENYFELDSSVLIYPLVGEYGASLSSSKYARWPETALTEIEQKLLRDDRRAFHLIELSRIIEKAWGSFSIERDSQVIGFVEGADIQRAGFRFLRPKVSRKRRTA